MLVRGKCEVNGSVAESTGQNTSISGGYHPYDEGAAHADRNSVASISQPGVGIGVCPGPHMSYLYGAAPISRLLMSRFYP